MNVATESLQLCKSIQSKCSNHIHVAIILIMHVQNSIRHIIDKLIWSFFSYQTLLVGAVNVLSYLFGTHVYKKWCP